MNRSIKLTACLLACGLSARASAMSFRLTDYWALWHYIGGVPTVVAKATVDIVPAGDTVKAMVRVGEVISGENAPSWPVECDVPAAWQNTAPGEKIVVLTWYHEGRAPTLFAALEPLPETYSLLKTYVDSEGVFPGWRNMRHEDQVGIKRQAALDLPRALVAALESPHEEPQKLAVHYLAENPQVVLPIPGRPTAGSPRKLLSVLSKDELGRVNAYLQRHDASWSERGYLLMKLAEHGALLDPENSAATIAEDALGEPLDKIIAKARFGKLRGAEAMKQAGSRMDKWTLLQPARNQVDTLLEKLSPMQRIKVITKLNMSANPQVKDEAKNLR